MTYTGRDIVTHAYVGGGGREWFNRSVWRIGCRKEGGTHVRRVNDGRNVRVDGSGGQQQQSLLASVAQLLEVVDRVVG